MREPVESFTIKSRYDLVLNAKEIQDARKECVLNEFDDTDLNSKINFNHLSNQNDHDTFEENRHYISKTYLSQRYEFSDYIVDPLKFRFRMVVRVVGLVFLFICKLRLAVKKGAKFKFMEGDQTNLGLFQSRGDKLLLPDEGSQLIKGCKNMVISFSSIQHKLSCEYGVEFEPCATGAHYIHGKVERKIQQVKKSLMKTLDNNRLSVIQWETLAIKIANNINNLPIGIGNKTKDVENLYILTPNRLILGRNNDRCPTTPLELAHDHKRIIESNNKMFKAWFNSWLISYVPTLIEHPKWHYDDKAIEIGDVVLFLKAEQEFNLQYQYGIVISTNEGRDGRVRTIEIEYQNHQEKVKRTTTRGVRDVIVIHRVDELSAEENFHYLYLMTSTLLD